MSRRYNINGRYCHWYWYIVEELGSTATQGFMLLGMCVRRGYLKKIEEFF